jgi:NAD+ synthase (glutamine-hydrolysing)
VTTAPFRLALAQCRLVVGDLAGNAATVRRVAAEAAAAGAQFVAFPEMTLTGYPPEDLVLRRSFSAATEDALTRLAKDLDADGLGELPAYVGYLRRTEAGAHNSAAVLHRGGVAASVDKVYLPNYGVFDEDRYFLAGDRAVSVVVGGVRVALTICEDLWWPGPPTDAAKTVGADLLLCTNGSPYERGKAGFRETLLARRVAECGLPVAYVNQVGGQDELVFDGGSFVLGADGEVVARAAQFEAEILVVDLELEQHAATTATTEGSLTLDRIVISETVAPQGFPGSARVAEPLDGLAADWAAIVLGTRDYVDKNGFASVVIASSGGIDSAVVATIAVDALGGDRVHTVALPSAYSSGHSRDDAAELAARQGTHHRVVSIAPMVDAYQAALHLTGLAEENLQARVRGTLMMGLSNGEGHLVLTTGNKSELAVGFSTLYGDTAGGYAPIKDIPKTEVWALARWRNAQSPEHPPIPQQIIDKPPSAELAPGQLDTDRLPAYEVLDPLLESYVEHDAGRSQLLASGVDAEVADAVVRLVDLAEYKRRQNPPGPKVTAKAFGRDRRLPITNRWREAPSDRPSI